MPEYTCANCKFYDPINGKGRCKVNPPERKVTSSGEHLNMVLDGWPEVQGSGSSCGSFILQP